MLDDNETNKTKSDSSYLKKSIDALEATILCVLWHKILQRFHSRTKSVQRADMTLESLDFRKTYTGNLCVSKQTQPKNEEDFRL